MELKGLEEGPPLAARAVGMNLSTVPLGPSEAAGWKLAWQALGQEPPASGAISEGQWMKAAHLGPLVWL